MWLKPNKMNIDNTLHQSVIERVKLDPNYHVLCGLGGFLIYALSFYVIYLMFLKIYPEEQH
jgi:hypothetical protein